MRRFPVPNLFSPASFSMLSMDSWLWKIVVIGAIVVTREFVRLLTAHSALDANNSSPNLNFRAANSVSDNANSSRESQRDNCFPDSPAQALGAQNAAQRTALALRNLSQQQEIAQQNTRGLLEIMDAIAMAFGLVFFVIQPFLLQAFYIPSASMENTLQWQPVGDRLLVAKWIYKLRGPRFGEVVVFQPPSKARVLNGDDYIKRCIGAPGDVIFARNRRYFRRARGTSKTVELREPYVKWSADLPLSGYDMKIVGGRVYAREYSKFETAGLWQEEGAVGRDAYGVTFPPAENQGVIEAASPEAIPDGMFLVLGDHRNDSYDGHMWGLVPRANFVGKAMCIFWPPSRIGTLDRISGGVQIQTQIKARTRVRDRENRDREERNREKIALSAALASPNLSRNARATNAQTPLSSTR